MARPQEDDWQSQRNPQAGQVHADSAFFRYNYVTFLYESGIDPLVAMKIGGHSDYQTTANIYTHLSDETLRKAGINMGMVFNR